MRKDMLAVFLLHQVKFITFVNIFKFWLNPNKNNVHIRSPGYYSHVLLQWLHLLPRFFC